MLGAEEYIASTGGGLYRTRNAGRSWSRMDEQLDRSYFRESFKSNGRLYTSAALKTPSYWGGERGADAALYESFDGGSSFQRSEEHTSELQSRFDLVCRLLLEKKK